MTSAFDPAAARSWLFVPGDSDRKMAKARDGDADIVLIDLEDAVAEEAKSAARDTVRGFLADNADQRHRLWVRVNALDGPHTLDDLCAVMAERPGGLMLPKVSGRADVERFHHYVEALENTHGIARGSTGLIALVTETAEAMYHTGSYKGAPRLTAITWGAEDLAAALGAASNLDENGEYGFTFEMARSFALIGAATAGVPAIDTIHADFRDLDALKRRCARVRNQGFSGMLAIHPAQVPVINAAFTPSAEEIADAREIVALFTANPGVGTIGHKGTMLDKPFLTRAESVLRRAGLD